jgi:hypothetical protein
MKNAARGNKLMDIPKHQIPANATPCHPQYSNQSIGPTIRRKGKAGRGGKFVPLEEIGLIKVER